MAGRESRLAATRWNRLVDVIVERALARRDLVLQQLLADGFPPGFEMLTPREEFSQLRTLRDTNDPRFWDNVAAQRRLEQLAARFTSRETMDPLNTGMV